MRRLRREPTENLATAQLRHAILTGALSPGTRLRQVALAARFGVSRMPVRQALLALENEGLVKTDAWRGSIVAPLEADSIRDMYAVRCLLEEHVAEQLAARSDFEPAPLRKVIVSARRALGHRDYLRLVELDLKFHELLCGAFGNQVLLEVTEQQRKHIRRIMALILKHVQYRAQVWDEHDAIVDAIEAGKPKLAGRLMWNHVDSSARKVIEQLETLSRVEPDGSRGRH